MATHFLRRIENTKNQIMERVGNFGKNWQSTNFSKVRKYPWESLECDTERSLSMGWAGRYRSPLETQLTT